MSIELIVQNTNSSQLYVQSFAGNLFSNSYLIGNVSSFQQIMIPGNSQRIFIVNVKLQPLGVVNDIINAFQTGSFTQFLKLDASANVDGVQLPVQLEFKVGL
jgi:LEA14-like dessication related protein